MKTAHWVSWCFASLSISASAADLSESTFTQVINDVSVVSPATKTTVKAVVSTVLRSPELVRTGPNSRAELKAQDQTLTRIGANTIFAFEPQGRTINLQQGSVLFHSPTGRGGGTIKTGGASAAVLGTTLVIVATPNGGFKGIVLEGKGKFTLPNGNARDLKAGQLLFILPGSRSFGPTLNINLSKMVEGSGLVKGYSSELSSMPKVQAAMSVQEALISSGKVQDTGLLVGNNATKDTVTVVDAATFAAAINENKTAVEKAAKHDVELQDSARLDIQIFHRSASGKKFPNSGFKDISVSYALVAEDVTIKNVEGGLHVTLPKPWESEISDHASTFFGILASQDIRIKGDVEFHNPWLGEGEQAPGLVLNCKDLTIANYKTVRFDSPTGFLLGAQHSIELDGVTLRNATGPLTLQSRDGKVELNGVTLSAGGAIEVLAKDDKVKIRNSTLAGRSIRVVGGDLVDIRNSNLEIARPSSSLGSGIISMEAKTIVMSDLDLDPSHSNRPILLACTNGKLAPYANNPNGNGGVVRPGFVNWLHGVTVQGRDAVDHYGDTARPNPTAQVQIRPL